MATVTATARWAAARRDMTTTTTTTMATGDDDDKVDDDCDGATCDEVDDDCNGATRADDDLWGAGGSASSLEGRRRRLPTRGRPHWSRAFNNAGDGTGALRGGGGAKRCDVTTSWRDQRGGVEDGCVRRLPDEM
jgi:hypothetical protein